jgi:3-hydroxyisobutyrate dehydrogenase-like beta-hydroxyacid dehydrogenase
MKPGAIFVDHTTGLGQRGARAGRRSEARRGLQFVDAPVSGGQAGAQNGLLTVMCGGEQAAFDAASRWRWPSRAPSRCWARAAPASSAKMVNQVAIAGWCRGCRRPFAFGTKAGLDMEQVLEVIGKGAARAGRWTTAARP